ncbi:hypothetical protein D3C71_1789940 [compost metagenome]
MFGVGPVTAPHQAFGRVGLKQKLGGLPAGCGAVRTRPVAVGRGQLHPNLAAAGVLQQVGKAGVGHTQRRIGAAEMVDHHSATGRQ